MADTKISALTALTGANVASGDLFPIVDVSDTTMAASGTDKKITATELATAMALLRPPSRVVDEAHADTVASNTTTETTLASLTLPGGLVAAGDLLVFEAIGELLNNTGANATYTWKFKIGATTVLTSAAPAIANNANTRRWWLRLPIAVAGTTSQVVGGMMFIDTASASNWPLNPAGTGLTFGAAYGTATEDTSTSKTVVLTVAMGGASVNQTATLHAASLLYHRKG